jgi:hypothetical protein
LYSAVDDALATCVGRLRGSEKLRVRRSCTKGVEAGVKGFRVLKNCLKEAHLLQLCAPRCDFPHARRVVGSNLLRADRSRRGGGGIQGCPSIPPTP